MRLPNQARLKLFYHFLHPFSEKRRAKRMQDFVTRMNIRPDLRVLDLGGTAWIWRHLDIPLNITFVNLAYSAKQPVTDERHTFTFEIGDACSLPKFDDKSFDIVFSNSVIEHVGDREKRAAFAGEVRRLADAYWIQTPAKSFPIEAHCGMPFWWYYPEPVREYYLNKWKKNLSRWAQMVEETTYLTEEELDHLFDGSMKYKEIYFGFSKSICRFVPCVQ